jgi:hypothetical protein
MEKIYLTKEEFMQLWQKRWGPLYNEQQTQFLEKETLDRIIRFQAHQI